jgi:uncharacterized surface protein with fasciclin (FAS1) repeats
VKILTCHVIPAKALAADITKMAMDDGGTHDGDDRRRLQAVAQGDGGKVTITDEKPAASPT